MLDINALKDGIYRINIENEEIEVWGDKEVTVVKIGKWFYPYFMRIGHKAGGCDDSYWDGYDYVVDYYWNPMSLEDLIYEVKAMTNLINDYAKDISLIYKYEISTKSAKFGDECWLHMADDKRWVRILDADNNLKILAQSGNAKDSTIYISDEQNVFIETSEYSSESEIASIYRIEL